MSRPTFLIIGAKKAGTTALWKYLSHHPQVYVPQVKELEYFSRNWDRSWAWYERRFRDAGSAAVAVGEASPSYASRLRFPEAPERIASRLPEVKLIYLVRHPVDRIASQYLHSLAVNEAFRPIEAELANNPAYVEDSQYASEVESYLEHFPRHQLLVIQSERLRDNRVRTLIDVYRFLGIDEAPPPVDRLPDFYRAEDKRPAEKRSAIQKATTRSPRLRATRAARARLSPRWRDSQYARLKVLPPNVEQRLTEILRPEVARLRPYMDHSFDGWGIA